MKRPPHYREYENRTPLTKQREQSGDSGRSTESEPVYAHLFCPHREARPLVPTVFPTDPPTIWSRTNDLTSFRYTTFHIVDRKDVYNICDEVEVKIVARDGFNKKRRVGGDYFRVKAITMDADFSAGTSSDGAVVDHEDGTYSAYITLKVNKHIQYEEKCNKTRACDINNHGKASPCTMQKRQSIQNSKITFSFSGGLCNRGTGFCCARHEAGTWAD